MEMMTKIQEDMAKDRVAIDERLGKLEVAKESVTVVKEEPEGRVVEKVEISSTREKQLSKSFGIDTSATALLEFLDHYKLCVEINQSKNVPGWSDAAYRARELRFQLQGEVAGT